MSAPAETVAGLRDQVTTTETEVARLTFLADELANQRRAALLDEDDRRLAAVERELLQVERDRERGRLKVEALSERLRAVEDVEHRAALDRKRQEMVAECEAQMDRARRVDRALLELAAAVEEWWTGEMQVRGSWLLGRFADRLGPITYDFIPPVAPLLGAIPVRLANLLRLTDVNPHGRRPLVELDVAAAALARLGGPPAPKPVRAPEEPARIVHSTPGGVTVAHQPGA